MPKRVYLNGSIGRLSAFWLKIPSIGQRNRPFNQPNQARFETLVSV
jgi:hypothetical protein